MSCGFCCSALTFVIVYPANSFLVSVEAKKPDCPNSYVIPLATRPHHSVNLPKAVKRNGLLPERPTFWCSTFHHFGELDEQQCRRHKRGPLSREKIRKCFLRSQSLRCRTLKGRQDTQADPPATSHSLPLNDAKANKKITLLTLPLKIQLQIYDLFLVSRFDPMKNPSWAVVNSDQKMVMLHMIQDP